jgi:hypothetical protein
VHDRLLRNPQQAIQLLQLYQRILQQTEVVAANSPDHLELLLSGLVVKRQGVLSVHNRIYELIFNSRWIESTIAALR